MRLLFAILAFAILSLSVGHAAVEERTTEKQSAGIGAEGLASLSYIFLSKTQAVNFSDFPILGDVSAESIFGLKPDRIPNLLDLPKLGYVNNDKFKFAILPPLTERAPFGVSASWMF